MPSLVSEAHHEDHPGLLGVRIQNVLGGVIALGDGKADVDESRVSITGVVVLGAKSGGDAGADVIVSRQFVRGLYVDGGVGIT